MTNAERKLWFALRDRRFANFKFRRQVPLGPYIADYVCYQVRVVIEVDGGQHAGSRHDARRDHWLAANDFLVLRFWNNDVLGNLEGVLTQVLTVLLQRSRRESNAYVVDDPSPASPLRGSAPSPTRGEGIQLASRAKSLQ